MLRQAAEETGELVGDGTSTATILAHAILADAILADGVRNVVAGASAVDLKRGLDRATREAVAALAAFPPPAAGARLGRREVDPPQGGSPARRRSMASFEGASPMDEFVAPALQRPPGAAPDVLAAIYGRRSVRDYEREPPSRELIAQIVADAVQAPNSINRQAWSFVVVTGREQLADISRSAKAQALTAIGADVPPELRQMLANEAFDIFYNAPTLVVICATLPDPMVAQDCCLAAQTLMLSAFARGLGSCWIGFAEGWLNTPEGKRRLGLPAESSPVAPIILGHPRAHPAPPGRKPPQITWIDTGR
jgi:nitroreductase